MRILPVNEDALLVELPGLPETLALFDALQQRPIAGVTAMVPAARTLLLRFDPAVCNPYGLAALVSDRRGGQSARASGAVLKLPVVYDGEDLDWVARHLGLSVAELIRRHAASVWQVAFTGFAPGFAYLSGGDPVFDVPRRSSPRTRIPAGAVALADRFCGIYPRQSPGGWQLLGTTGVPMWDLARSPPALLQPGQAVQFVDAATPAGQQLLAQWRSVHAAAPAPGSGSGSGSAAASSLLPGAAERQDQASAPVFEVITPGLQALFQDLGRPGLAAQGVSPSGALDRDACLLANRLVGNERGAAVLELLHGGFALRVLQPAVVACTGAAGPLVLQHADASLLPAGRWAPLALERADVLRVGVPEAGLRSYLAVRGGFRAEVVLGSCATDTLSGLGPAPLVAGQQLFAGDRTAGAVMIHPVPPQAALPALGADPALNIVTLDVVLGPRTDWFDAESVGLLYRQPWQVSLQSNRVGLRLVGERPLQRSPARAGVELPSEGVVWGALQVPANGQPVLFLADHPLTGGYPVIACVAPWHLGLAAQLPVGAMVRFRPLAPFAEIPVPF